LGVVLELARRDAHDAPALGREGAVAGAVSFEPRAGAVGLEAVELDDEALCRPPEVGPDRAAETERLGALAGSRELVLVENGGEVEERACRRGDGDASCSSRSSGRRAVRCRAMPGRRWSLRAAISMMAGSRSVMRHSTAAVRRRSTAFGPMASTAAIHRPWCVRERCPTAYTPRWRTCRRPRCTCLSM
jgi:hypothetical protein